MTIIVEVLEILDSGSFEDLEKKAKSLGYERPNLREFIVRNGGDGFYHPQAIGVKARPVCYLTNHGSDSAIIYQDDIGKPYKLAKFKEVLI